MHNDNNDPLSSPFTFKDAPALGENKILVAATLAAVVVAGSAMIYRHAATASSKEHPAKEPLLEATPCLESEQEGKWKGVIAVPLDVGADIATGSMSIASGMAGQEEEGSAGTNNASMKCPRSKERRKRRKDPLREVLKSGKKLKSFAVPNAPSMLTSPGLASAPFSSSSSSTRKERQLSDSAGSSTSFQSPEPSSSSPFLPTQPQILVTSLQPSFTRRNSDKRRQREESVVMISTSTVSEDDTLHLPLSGHTRTMFDVSEISRSSHEGYNGDEEREDDALFRRASYNQHTHQQNSSQASLTQSSLSRSSRPPSSLADVSEVEGEDGGWVMSVPKVRSRNRVQLADVIFGAEYVENESKLEENLLWQTEDEEIPTLEIRSTAIATSDIFQDSMILQPDEKATSMDKSPLLPVATPPPSQLNEKCTPDILHQDHSFPNPMLLSPHFVPSPEKNKSRVQKSQIQQNKSHGGDKSATPSANDDENEKTPINEHENEGHKKPPRLEPKGTIGASYASFSSALVEGGDKVVIGQSRTVAVSVNMLDMSASGSGLAGGNENFGSSLGTDDDKRDQKEFTFPTLNAASPAAPSGSTRTRSALTGPSAISSPSKKNRRTGTPSHKSGTPPPHAVPLRTTSPLTPSLQSRESGQPGSGSGNTPALSAQTQLASLRGALEAARLREEIHKAEMERLTKEMEVLKLESTNKQRGEAELQAQVRHLAHQLQTYAAMFASVAPQLNAHFQQQLHSVPQQTLQQPELSPAIWPSEEQVNGTVYSESSPLEPRSSSNIDPNVDNAGLASPCERPLTPPQEKQQEDQNEHEDEATSSSTTSAEKAQDQKQVQATPEIPPSSSFPCPPTVDIPSSPPEEPHALASPPPSASIPSPLLPYSVPPYLHLHHTHPVQPYSWMQYHYQQTPNANGGQSSPLHHHHYYPSMFSPVIFPASPIAPPFSPPGAGIMSPHLLHQYPSYGFGANGLPSAGLSSAGSGSPDLTGSPGIGMNSKQRSRMKRRKLQMANLNSNRNSKMGSEDVVDGWSGSSTVPAAQPSAVAEIGKSLEADDSVLLDAEGEHDGIANANSLYDGFLADAILKRPGSLRAPSAMVMKKIGKIENRSVERQQHSKSNEEGGEEFTEFTFPSLSDFGHVYYRTASRTESSISSSLSSSPPSTTATVPDSVGDSKPEDDRASLPPLIEKSEDSDQSSVDVLRQAEVEETVHDVLEAPTPRKEDQESPLVIPMERL